MHMAMKAYIAPSTRPKVPIRASVAAKTRPTYQIITYLFFIFEGTLQFFEIKAIYFRPARVRGHVSDYHLRVFFNKKSL
jgi:hypothetical protein